jgi:predicted RND superfamily exporter protein
LGLSTSSRSISPFFSSGIGVDFAIQFSVRYREERHRLGDLHAAVRSAGARIMKPLALAALATAAGFFSFVPTDYRGVSELGLIAGVGMLIAFLTSVTVLPALIVLVNPRASRNSSAMPPRAG